VGPGGGDDVLGIGLRVRLVGELRAFRDGRGVFDLARRGPQGPHHELKGGLARDADPGCGVGERGRDRLGRPAAQCEAGVEYVFGQPQQAKAPAGGEALPVQGGHVHGARVHQGGQDGQVHVAAGLEQVDDPPGRVAHLIRDVGVQAAAQVLQQLAVFAYPLLDVFAGPGQADRHVFRPVVRGDVPGRVGQKRAQRGGVPPGGA